MRREQAQRKEQMQWKLWTVCTVFIAYKKTPAYPDISIGV